MKEFPIKNCRTLTFSHGGHLIAAANANTIAIFSSLSCEQIGVLRSRQPVLMTLKLQKLYCGWVIATSHIQPGMATKGCNALSSTRLPPGSNIVGTKLTKLDLIRTTVLYRGHSGKVRCLAWSTDDYTLASAGADGAVYDWSLKEQRRVRENVIKV